MIKILLLILLVIVFIFILKNSNEYFSTVQLRCGLAGSGGIGTGLGNNTGVGLVGSSGSGISGEMAIVGVIGDISQHPNVNTQERLVTVNPNLPECVGICINQHTYTKQNSKNIIGFSEDYLGQVKSNQNDNHVMATGCGECLNNFYTGIQLMKDKSNSCLLN